MEINERCRERFQVSTTEVVTRPCEVDGRFLQHRLQRSEGFLTCKVTDLDLIFVGCIFEFFFLVIFA